MKIEKVSATFIFIYGDNTTENGVCIDVTVQEKAVIVSTSVKPFRKSLQTVWYEKECEKCRKVYLACAMSSCITIKSMGIRKI